MKRAVAQEQQDREEDRARAQDRFTSTLVIAAAIIAAVRLARVESIARPTLRLTTAIQDGVELAMQILAVIRGPMRFEQSEGLSPLQKGFMISSFEVPMCGQSWMR